ncbi:MAG: PEP-CTERM sorting domain-containing protein [Luteolibacter sp.]
MKTPLTLSLALTFLTCSAHAQSLVNGTNYSDLFGPNGANVTVNPTNSLLLTIGGSASDDMGTYWNASASGGASVLLGVSESGARINLTGSSLQFGVVNTGLVGDLLDAGLTGLTVNWSATATFDKAGNQLVLQPNTTYQVSFLLDGSNGLLDSGVAVLPQFHVELLDGANNNIGTASSGTLVDVVGLLGSGVTSGPVTVSFTTGNTVNSNPASIRFSGSGIANVSVLGLGTTFATVSGLNITQVPEPSSFGLIGFSALALLRRKR